MSLLEVGAAVGLMAPSAIKMYQTGQNIALAREELAMKEGVYASQNAYRDTLTAANNAAMERQELVDTANTRRGLELAYSESGAKNYGEFLTKNPEYLGFASKSLNELDFAKEAFTKAKLTDARYEVGPNGKLVITGANAEGRRVPFEYRDKNGKPSGIVATMDPDAVMKAQQASLAKVGFFKSADEQGVTISRTPNGAYEVRDKTTGELYPPEASKQAVSKANQDAGAAPDADLLAEPDVGQVFGAAEKQVQNLQAQRAKNEAQSKQTASAGLRAVTAQGNAQLIPGQSNPHTKERFPDLVTSKEPEKKSAWGLIKQALGQTPQNKAYLQSRYPHLKEQTGTATPPEKHPKEQEMAGTTQLSGLNTVKPENEPVNRQPDKPNEVPRDTQSQHRSQPVSLHAGVQPERTAQNARYQAALMNTAGITESQQQYLRALEAGVDPYQLEAYKAMTDRMGKHNDADGKSNDRQYDAYKSVIGEIEKFAEDRYHRPGKNGGTWMGPGRSAGDYAHLTSSMLNRNVAFAEAFGIKTKEVNGIRQIDWDVLKTDRQAMDRVMAVFDRVVQSHGQTRGFFGETYNLGNDPAKFARGMIPINQGEQMLRNMEKEPENPMAKETLQELKQLHGGDREAMAAELALGMYVERMTKETN